MKPRAPMRAVAFGSSAAADVACATGLVRTADVSLSGAAWHRWSGVRVLVSSVHVSRPEIVIVCSEV